MTKIPPPKPGLYHNVPFTEYQSWNCVNNSVLKILADDRQSPAHAKWFIDNGRKDTDALKFGRALDAYILEPLRFLELYAVCPKCDKRTKDGKKIYGELVKSLKKRMTDGIDITSTGIQKSIEIIDQDDYDKIIQIGASVINSQAMRLIQGGQSQVCAVWVDKETGLTCKSRLDYYQKNIPMITDLKSTTDCSPFGFGYDLFKFGYFQQAGFYCMGHEVLTGEDPLFAIFAIEKEEPYVHASYELGMSTIEAGKNAARQALRIYKKCMESGNWPMYSDKTVLLEMPLFGLKKFGIDQYQI